MSISINDIYNKMTEFLYCHDDMRTTLDVCLGTVIAQRFDIENCWLMVVGPPSSGKSLMLQSLTDSIKVMFMDDLSNSSLISGYRDETKMMIFTTHYLSVYSECVQEGRVQDIKELDIDLIITLDNVVSVSYFDIEMYDRFMKPSQTESQKK